MTKRTGIILGFICLVGLGIRLLPMETVFGGSFVSFIETDAYSRMYYAQQIANMSVWDGIVYTFQNNLLFSWLVAMSSHVMPIEVAGAIWPPILGIGTIIVVYFLAARLFNPTVGLLSALFTAVIPSEFLHRTLLGFADHHALEVFLFTLMMYCVVRVIQADKHRWRWVTGGGMIFVAYIINWKTGVVMVALLGMIAAGILIYGLIKKSQWKQPVLAIGVICLVALARYGLMLLLPGNGTDLTASATQEVASTLISPFATRTISELRPMLFPVDGFSLNVVISNLHLFAVMIFVGAWFLLRGKADGHTKILLLVWSGFMLAAALLFRRNLYYFTINIAILSAVAVWEMAVYLKGKQAVQAAIISIPLVLMSLPMASLLGQNPAFTMSEEWHNALDWLKTQQVTGHVTAWSDYGHWIKYVTDHDPNLLPGPGGTEVAQLYLSTDTQESKTLMDDLNTEYLIVDTPTLNYKIGALTTISGRHPEIFSTTLIHRLWYQNAPQPYLVPVYESETIKIFKYYGG